MFTESDGNGTKSGSSTEGFKEVTDGKVEDSERKTLAEKSGYLGQVDGGELGDGVRVLEESKAFVGEERLADVKSEIELGEGRGDTAFKMTDKFDETKNRVVEMMSRDDGWGSRGVMGLVGKVLGGKSCMNDDVEEDVKNLGTGNGIKSTVAGEVEDAKNFGTMADEVEVAKNFGTMADEVEVAKNFGTKHDINSVMDCNAQQDVAGEPISENGNVVNETVICTDSHNEKSDYSYDRAGVIEEQHLVINEQVPDGSLESTGLDNVNNADVLLPTGGGDECLAKKEVEYNVSDLVWGKVRSHPWWPGQIFAPSAASDKAIIHFKKDNYLIAYFGDQTFAWNEVSTIKPFQMHFTEMEKQSEAERFCRGVRCALNEVARRVEFGLSCQCLPKEAHAKIKSQVIKNAGIKEESSIREGGDCLSTAASFVPGDLLQFIKSLAVTPLAETDRLQHEITKAQILAFNRWKGYYKLSIFEQHDGLLENDAQFTVEGGNSRDLMNGVLSDSIDAVKVPSKKRKSPAQDASSRKRKHLSNIERSKTQENCLPILTSSTNSNLQTDKKFEVKCGMKTVSTGKKRGSVTSIPGISNAKRPKRMLSPMPSETYANLATCSGGGTNRQSKARKSTIEEMIPADFDPHEVLLKLMSAAINPMQGYGILNSILGLFREIRNSTYLEKFHSQSSNNHTRKSDVKKSCSLETTETLQVEVTEDSYWTDRIIQGYSQAQVLFERKEPTMKNASGAELEASIGTPATLDCQNHQDSVILGCEAENSSAQRNEGPEEYCPTALLLTFTNLDSIPSVTNLNEIFRCYGSLDQTQTKILSKSKRAKVIFTRRADAETAFSSTGKYSIFGPALLSYRLHYIARKAHAAKGKKTTHP